MEGLKTVRIRPILRPRSAEDIILKTVDAVRIVISPLGIHPFAIRSDIRATPAPVEIYGVANETKA